MGNIITAGQVFGAIKNFFKRIAFHVIAFISALVITKADAPEFFCAYLGIICILPMGFNLKQNRYLFPAVISVGQLLITWQWGGAPFPLALFWAGTQSWLIHAAIRHFKMRWEWAALPYLLLGYVLSHDIFRFPVAFFLFCTACGYVSYTAATLRENKTLLGRQLTRILRALDPALKVTTYPQEFDVRFRQLEKQAGSFLVLGVFKKSRYCEVLLPMLEETAPVLEQALKWPEEKFNDRDATNLLASLADLGTIFEDALSGEQLYTGQKSASGKLAVTGTGNGDEYSEYRSSAAQLLAKKDKLPQEMQKHLNAIFLSTGSIISCMRDDPDDRAPGMRFLNRYLPSVHKVVDEYIRLGAENRGHQDIQPVLDKSADLLGRMATAFHEEHGNLLRNDTMRLSADLNALDKLLKMDGR
ncbi:5-bromo-4-chloroindolyl phosphate hydrolysis family protein [Desulfovibrio sp. OttesenSCG-928-C06]|nr:5-bromo-4-chloroindolyl phosphate hydrolysis family protein [Desulfovibrio sp. OttesenSCG-928-C06]